MLDGVYIDPRFHPALTEQYRAASQSGLRVASLPVLARNGRCGSKHRCPFTTA
jgi:hypothetical protein